MALKDWVKGRSFRGLFVFHKNNTNKTGYEGDAILINQLNKSERQNRFPKVKDIWEFKHGLYTKYFKSKSQALKFAKSYMRTH